MKKVKLTIFGSYAFKPLVYVNNNLVKLKKEKNEKLTYNFETEQETLDIEIYKVLEVNARGYLFFQILFFLISLFGIFNSRLDKKCIIPQLKYNFKLVEDTDIKFRLNTPQVDFPVVKLESNCEFDMLSNKYIVDQEAKNRLKKLKIIKLAILILAIITAILLIVLL